MNFDYDFFKKAFQMPFNGDNGKAFRKQLAENITKAAELHTQFLRSSMDTMKKLQDMWMQGVDWYIESQKKVTNFITERISGQE